MINWFATRRRVANPLTKINQSWHVEISCDLATFSMLFSTILRSRSFFMCKKLPFNFWDFEWANVLHESLKILSCLWIMECWRIFLQASAEKNSLKWNIPGSFLYINFKFANYVPKDLTFLQFLDTSQTAKSNSKIFCITNLKFLFKFRL